MINRICPLLSIADAASADSYTDCMRDSCAWAMPGTGQCAVFGIFDQLADVSARVDELRDVIEDGVKVFKVNE